MDDPKPIFKLNSRVRLRDGVDPTLYGGWSRVGNEAWVRDREVDEMGYPHIFIEWDKDHWSYNGAPDVWTWEPHFELVEEDDMSEISGDDKREDVLEVFKTLLDMIEDKDEPSPERPKRPSELEREEADFKKRAKEVGDVIARSRAYVVVTIDDDEDEDVIKPLVFQDARNETAALICQAQLTQAYAGFQTSIITSRLHELSQDDDGEE